MELEDRTPAFIVGLDLGMLSDHSALVVLSTIDEEYPRRYAVPHIDRFPLMTGYEHVISHVVNLFSTKEMSPKHDRYIVIDAGGVGRPVLEMLQRKLDLLGVDVIGVTITGGFDVVRSAMNDYRVPKRDIVGAIQSALGGRRLRVAAGLSDAEQLEHELRQMTLKITPSGHDQYEALSEKDHDDIVMALGIAIWFADLELPTVDVSGEWKVEEPKEMIQLSRDRPGDGPPVGLDDLGGPDFSVI